MASKQAAAVIAAILVMGLGSAAQAGEVVRADCRAMVKPTDVLRFDTDLHQRWYKRFWTGTCDRLPHCISGSPNWNDIVGKLVVLGGPSEQATLLPKACRLGQTIGLEWSRDKKVRRIDTADLRAFKGQLEKSGDALRGVEQVEASARAKLAR